LTYVDEDELEVGGAGVPAIPECRGAGKPVRGDGDVDERLRSIFSYALAVFEVIRWWISQNVGCNHHRQS
jgi:hypothetical protein